MPCVIATVQSIELYWNNGNILKQQFKLIVKRARSACNSNVVPLRSSDLRRKTIYGFSHSSSVQYHTYYAHLTIVNRLIFKSTLIKSNTPQFHTFNSVWLAVDYFRLFFFFLYYFMDVELCKNVQHTLSPRRFDVTSRISQFNASFPIPVPSTLEACVLCIDMLMKTHVSRFEAKANENISEISQKKKKCENY